MYQKILVPLDGSELAEQALLHARSLAERMDVEIALLRVSAYPTYDFILVDPTLRQTIAEIHDGEVKYLRNLVTTLRESGFRATGESREGDAAETILKYAEQIHADLIVMCTHGRSGLARWLMGSVANKVVQAAKIPVLLIRPTGDHNVR